MNDPMFTERELGLFDMLVNPAKWHVRDEINLKVGELVRAGFTPEKAIDRVRTNQQRFDELHDLSTKVKELRRNERRRMLGLPPES